MEASRPAALRRVPRGGRVLPADRRPARRVRSDCSDLPPRGVLGNDRARRDVPGRQQLPALADARALGARARRALRLRVVGGDLRFARERPARGSRTARARPAQHVRLLEASLRSVGAARRACSSRIVGVKYFNVFGPNEDHKGDMRSMVAKAYEQIAADGAIRLFKSYRDGVARRRTDARLPLRQGRGRRDAAPRAHARTRTGSTTSARASRAAGTISRARSSRRWIDPCASPTSKCPTSCAANTSTVPKPPSTGFARAGYTAPFTTLEDAVTEYVRTYLLKGAVLTR